MNEKTLKFQLRLIGAGLGLLFALAIWPGTGWLVRSQFALISGTPGALAAWETPSIAGWQLGFRGSEPGRFFSAFEVARQEFKRVANANPNDPQIQLATLSVPATNDLAPVEEFLRLARAFPNDPAICAAVLRDECRGRIRVDREEARFAMDHPWHQEVRSAGCDDSEALAWFDLEALRGEQLDPANAYFPVMRAAGLLISHRDPMALAELRRASQMQVWDDYCEAEFQGDLKLADQALGRGSALDRLGWADSIMLPHLAVVKRTCVTAAGLAVEDERAGRKAEGLAIRLDVLRVGELMRARSANMIGALVGVAIERGAMTSPGGKASPDVHPGEADSSDQQIQIADAFKSYLNGIGRPDEVPELDKAEKASVESIRIAASGRGSIDSMHDAVGVNWVLDVVVLSNILWVVLLGVAGTLLARHPRIVSRQSLPRAWKIGALVGLLLAGAGSAFQLQYSLWPIVRATVDLTMETHMPAWEPVTFGIALSGPILTVVVLTITSLACRVPLSIGLTRGLRSWAAPVACVLLIGYAALLFRTVRSESNLDDAITAMSRHEGQYLASLQGKNWP
jgi:hypothetical protein